MSYFKTLKYFFLTFTEILILKIQFLHVAELLMNSSSFAHFPSFNSLAVSLLYFVVVVVDVVSCCCHPTRSPHVNWSWSSYVFLHTPRSAPYLLRSPTVPPTSVFAPFSFKVLSRLSASHRLSATAQGAVVLELIVRLSTFSPEFWWNRLAAVIIIRCCLIHT